MSNVMTDKDMVEVFMRLEWLEAQSFGAKGQYVTFGPTADHKIGVWVSSSPPAGDLVADGNNALAAMGEAMRSEDNPIPTCEYCTALLDPQKFYLERETDPTCEQSLWLMAKCGECGEEWALAGW